MQIIVVQYLPAETLQCYWVLAFCLLIVSKHCAYDFPLWIEWPADSKTVSGNRSAIRFLSRHLGIQLDWVSFHTYQGLHLWILQSGSRIYLGCYDSHKRLALIDISLIVILIFHLFADYCNYLQGQIWWRALLLMTRHTQVSSPMLYLMLLLSRRIQILHCVCWRRLKPFLPPAR